MRISTSQAYTSGLDRMQDVQSALNELQAQVNTGFKISKPSDDPIAYSQALKLKEEIALNEQFTRNTEGAISRNQLAESMIDATVTSVQRLRDLAVQASSDTLNTSDRQDIAAEVRIVQEGLSSLLNARDAGGEFLFGGFQGRDAPFVERPGGGYDYRGDDGQRRAQIGGTTFVDISDSGKDLFVDIPAANNTVVTRASRNNSPTGEASISVGQITDQQALDEIYPEKYAITFGDPDENQNRRTYTVTRLSDGDIVNGTIPAGGLADVTYITGEPIEFNGVQVAIGGEPQAGDTFFVESTNNQSLMTTVERFSLAIEGLVKQPAEREAIPSLVGRASPPRPTLTSAGNYVAAQNLTLTGNDGSVQNLAVAANAQIGDVAANLDALNGVEAKFIPAEATLDFSTTAADETDVIQFRLNELDIAVTAGATAADTYTAIDAALGAALPANGVSYTNDGAGRFKLTQANGDDIAIESFQVIDHPSVKLGIQGGLTAGENLEFNLTGTNGESLDINYTAAGADNDELLTQAQAQITAAGLNGVFEATQTNPGEAVRFVYTGDTNGNSNILLSGLTDNASNNVSLAITETSGSDVTNAATNGAATTFQPGIDVQVTAQEGRSSLGFGGALGTPVTLRDGGNDSSLVAAQLSYTLNENFTLQSDVKDDEGGLIPSDDSSRQEASFSDLISTSLANIDNLIDNLSDGRSKIGARLNMLDTTISLNAAFNQELDGFLSDIQDLDYAAALTEVQYKTFILQASQNTFVKITGLTLFNYL